MPHVASGWLPRQTVQVDVAYLYELMEMAQLCSHFRDGKTEAQEV